MYSLLPFQFGRVPARNVLVVNECGDHYFLAEEVFSSFIEHRMDESSDEFLDLKSKLFLYQDDPELSLQKIAARYRTRKSFLREFTSLHMLVVTLRCNQRCDYCQASSADEGASQFDMTSETAFKIVDMVFRSPSRHPKIEFQGGEPLLNWTVIRDTVKYAERKATETGKEASFVVCTNLTAVTLDQLSFLRDHRVSISTSLDGPQCLHDMCRKTRQGGATHAGFESKLELARGVLGNGSVNALMTTTAHTLGRMGEVTDEYLRLGMNGIFIRSLNPYGFAAEDARTLGYASESFVDCYLKSLEYIFELNRNVYFPEYFASLLFSRILTPYPTGFVDLQSPSGCGISGAIYDYDGSVFPSDEARMLARMGDRHFFLGNVLNDSFEDIFAGKKLRALTAGACVETTPCCARCVYQAFCGTDPVRNYLETGDELRSMECSPFCAKHKGVFNGLFRILKENDPFKLDVIWSWITKNRFLVERHENC
ncbi:MAG: His-Xaa-Ser system radical SAM maturase HxsB [Deltaproteobacteria bacterium]|jgi:His-Xaa-Ser system radical SAM maturase HxsB|nr:His-Xaa-Ser system radical SAM maturase HxsB [Deltaproteobacteria bacterium]